MKQSPKTISRANQVLKYLFFGFFILNTLQGKAQIKGFYQDEKTAIRIMFLKSENNYSLFRVIVKNEQEQDLRIEIKSNLYLDAYREHYKALAIDKTFAVEDQDYQELQFNIFTSKSGVPKCFRILPGKTTTDELKIVAINESHR